MIAFISLFYSFYLLGIPNVGYGPEKAWSACDEVTNVARNYRVCYGLECKPPNLNGIQHIRMTCNEDQKAIMTGK